MFQVCAGTQCELKEVCREEQRKVARKVNNLLSSVQARQRRRNYENLVNTPDALAGSQGGLQVIRGTHLSYHSQTAASAERTQDVQ